MKITVITFLLATLLSFPPSRGKRGGSVAAHPQSHSPEIPIVTYCDLVGDPQLYLDKTVRVKTTWARAAEGIYMYDQQCPNGERVGFTYAEEEGWCDQTRKNIKLLYDAKFHGRADVVVVGTFANKSRSGFFFSYKYLFVATCIEKVSMFASKYEGILEEGETYRGVVEYDHQDGLRFSIPLRIPAHQAVLVEWTNLKNHPKLKRPGENNRLRQIVFRVLTKRTAKVTGHDRWNVIYRCQIVRVE